MHTFMTLGAGATIYIASQSQTWISILIMLCWIFGMVMT